MLLIKAANRNEVRESLFLRTRHKSIMRAFVVCKIKPHAFSQSLALTINDIASLDIQTSTPGTSHANLRCKRQAENVGYLLPFLPQSDGSPHTLLRPSHAY
jgi:hypothetical protein